MSDDSIVKGIPDNVFSQVVYFLGVANTNSDHYMPPSEIHLIGSQIKAAYKDLENVTGVNWLESETANFDIALDIVCSKVFLKYYNNRDDAKNTENLKANIASETFKLKWCTEAVEKRRQANGS